MNLQIVMPVWGRYFRRLLQEFVLPSHLSDNNLPAIHKDIDVTYRLYTTEPDYKALTEEAPRLLVRLGEFARIEMVRLPDEVSFEYEENAQETPTKKNIRAMDRFDHTKFNLQSFCYFDSIEKQGHIGDTAFVIATADVVYSDGTFPAIVELLERGKRAVHIAVFDMLDEPAAAAIRERHASADQLTVTLPARELVRLALDHLHPSAAGALIDSPRFPSWKHNLLWRVGTEGLVMHWFSLHPLVLAPLRREAMKLNEQIDGGYVFTIVDDLETIHVVEDSDEICAAGLAPEWYYYAAPTENNRFAAPTLATVLHGLKNKLFRQYPDIDVFARHAIKFHAGPLTPAWEAVVAESDRTIAEVLAAYARIDKAVM